jgi:hypothetical protein
MRAGEAEAQVVPVSRQAKARALQAQIDDQFSPLRRTAARAARDGRPERSGRGWSALAPDSPGKATSTTLGDADSPPRLFSSITGSPRKLRGSNAEIASLSARQMAHARLVVTKAKAESRRLGNVPLFMGLGRQLGGDSGAKQAMEMIAKAAKLARDLRIDEDESLAMLIASSY